MSKISHYWTIVRLNAAGQIKIVEIPAAYQLLQQHFPDSEPDEAGDPLIQARLLALLQSEPSEPTAALCLRCFISHQIVQICTSLQSQFGDYYGFTLQDLLPYVLTDTGKLPASADCLAQQILQSFQPDASSLATWTARLVRQHRELRRFPAKKLPKLLAYL
ncbi:MAG: hypothetical protein HC780_21915 [Leptolyngbyaceae cyanobacterium CSU_1_3]|nr:hypothetical protein [Leptolyngbyaceae cyanobacterium CSU_1_3]